MEHRKLLHMKHKNCDHIHPELIIQRKLDLKYLLLTTSITHEAQKLTWSTTFTHEGCHFHIGASFQPSYIRIRYRNMFWKAQKPYSGKRKSIETSFSMHIYLIAARKTCKLILLTQRSIMVPTQTLPPTWMNE